MMSFVLALLLYAIGCVVGWWSCAHYRARPRIRNNVIYGDCSAGIEIRGAFPTPRDPV